MYLFTLLFVVVTFDIFTLCSSVAPSFVSPCETLSEDCLKKSIQKAVPGFVDGIPGMGLETLDPFRVEKLQLSFPGGLKLLFKEGASRGFREAIIDTAKFTKYNVLDIKFHFNLDITGQYESSGMFLLFPINGNGNAIIKCKKIEVGLRLVFGSKLKDDGKKYLEIKKYMVKHRFGGPIKFNITNLFQGNPEVSKAILNFMNNNWQLVADEFGTPIVNFEVKSVMRNIKHFFNVVPANELIYAPIDF